LSGADSSTDESERGGMKRIVALGVIILLLMAAGNVIVNGPPDWLANILSGLPWVGNPSQEGGNFTFTVYDPTFRGGSVNVTYPPDYQSLAAYALSLINQDRSTAGLTSVTLSPVPSGQQHANSMLYFGYFSHWDTEGLKPYMRYTLLKGTGAVEENVAWAYYSAPHFFTGAQVKDALKDLEWQMVYNDSEHDNGHRDNILDPLHNRVSIGIAYDRQNVYLVQDFENFYVNLSLPIVSGNEVNLVGDMSRIFKMDAVYVFFDATPSSVPTSALNDDPAYLGPYGPGSFIGGVTEPCTFSCRYFPGYVTVHATNWQVVGMRLNITFSLSPFVQKYGAGVYTIYLRTQDGKDLTSLSVWVS